MDENYEILQNNHCRWSILWVPNNTGAMRINPRSRTTYVKKSVEKWAKPNYCHRIIIIIITVHRLSSGKETPPQTVWFSYKNYYFSFPIFFHRLFLLSFSAPKPFTVRAVVATAWISSDTTLVIFLLPLVVSCWWLRRLHRFDFTFLFKVKFFYIYFNTFH